MMTQTSDFRLNWNQLGLLGLIAVFSGILVAGGCLIPEDLSECETDDDCREAYDKRSYCADDNVCETFTRQEYLAPPCDYATHGEPYESDAPVIGTILSGPANNENLMTSVELAYEEFENSGTTDLSVVVCSSNSDNQQAREAAEHLQKIGVEAIVGPDSSSQVIELGRDIFVPNGMMSVSPAATSGIISNIQDRNLLWQTIPSDEFQARALAKLALTRLGLEPDANSLDGNKLFIAAKEDDPYSQGLRSGVIDTLSTDITTDNPNFRTKNFTNPENVEGSPSYGEFGDEIASFEPDMVLIFGTEEVWTVIESTEDALPADAAPLYLTADGGNLEILEEAESTSAVNEHPDLVTDSRVIGTRPAINYENNTVYSSFSNSWEDAQNISGDESAADFPFIAEAYDAFFLIGIASIGTDKFTGPKLAEQVSMFTDPEGEIIDAQANGISQAVNKFSNGESFQLRGTTGELNFNEQGGPEQVNIALWCLEGDDNTNAKTETVSDGADSFLLKNGSEFTPRNCPDSSMQGN